MSTIGTHASGKKATNVYVWIDFVCPFCLIGESLIKDALKGLDARVVYLPFELRPFPTPTLRPEGDYIQAAWRTSVQPTADRHGVPIRLPSTSPQPHTRKAFIGMQFAAEHHLGAEYAEAVLSAFFQQDLAIGKTDVLCDIAASVRLPVAEFAAALDDPAYAQMHDRALSIATQFRIRAVPSVLIGEELPSGVSQPDVIRRAVERASVDLLDLD